MKEASPTLRAVEASETASVQGRRVFVELWIEAPRATRAHCPSTTGHFESRRTSHSACANADTSRTWWPLSSRFKSSFGSRFSGTSAATAGGGIS